MEGDQERRCALGSARVRPGAVVVLGARPQHREAVFAAQREGLHHRGLDLLVDVEVWVLLVHLQLVLPRVEHVEDGLQAAPHGVEKVAVEGVTVHVHVFAREPCPTVLGDGLAWIAQRRGQFPG